MESKPKGFPWWEGKEEGRAGVAGEEPSRFSLFLSSRALSFCFGFVPSLGSDMPEDSCHCQRDHATIPRKGHVEACHPTQVYPEKHREEEILSGALIMALQGQTALQDGFEALCQPLCWGIQAWSNLGLEAWCCSVRERR